ncbi:MAG TPA: ABC transporter substrate-binding protein [bacterium]|nr:ABC transporter substrate-binding protein [bacterium]
MLRIISIILALLPLIAEGKTPERVVVLSPAALRIMNDMGLIDKVVCTAEPYNKDIIKEEIKSVGFYHRPNIELIASCKPDLIITTYAGTPPETYKKLKNMGYELVLEKPKDMNSIISFIDLLDKKFNTNSEKIKQKFRFICENKKKKTFAILVGLDPLFIAGKGSFVSDAVECAGATNVFAGEYTRTNIETMILKKPDLIIIASKNPDMFKDTKKIKQYFKNIIVIDPEDILEPSTGILKGIDHLKVLFRSN